jgi:hypothetical protein
VAHRMPPCGRSLRKTTNVDLMLRFKAQQTTSTTFLQYLQFRRIRLYTCRVAMRVLILDQAELKEHRNRAY